VGIALVNSVSNLVYTVGTNESVMPLDRVM